MLKQRFGKKGFTMAELLIVIAIIAILVAIALPVFGAQLNKARHAVALANVRSAYSEYVTQAMLDGKDGFDENGNVVIYLPDLEKVADEAASGATVTFENNVITVTYKSITGTFTIDSDVSIQTTKPTTTP